MPPTPADQPTGQSEPKQVFHRKDDPDPNVRAGGAFPEGISDEGAAWAKAFGEAEPAPEGEQPPTE